MDTESNRYSHIAFDRDKQEYRDSSKFNINIRANSTIAAIVLVIMKLFTVVNGLTCATGQYVSTTYYSNGTIMDVCYTCFKGYYCMNSNLYSCPQPGYNNHTGSSSSADCVACPNGQYANMQGNGCYTCAADRYIVSDTSTDCSGICGPGNYISSMHNYCYTCPQGTTSPGGVTSCTPCPAGQSTNSAGTLCVDCNAGTYSTGGTPCDYCPTGQISDTSHTSCINCASGSYSNSSTAGCVLCPAGQYQPNSASASCLQCPGGHFSSSTGSTFCSVCGSNMYSNPGASLCTSCPLGTFSSPGASICSAVCGDSITAVVEGCDDGNTSNGDGCSSSCSVESGYICTFTTPNGISTCTTVCGDGKRAGNEQCDDGNLNDNDGCSKICKVESGRQCLGGSPTSKDICGEICGDGIVIVDTETNCDDGNTISGDGCSSNCIVEPGWSCTGGSLTSPDVCGTICGDGVLNTQTEECDDGNKNSGDGCSVYCIIEPGAFCITNFSAPINSYCSETCGDSK